MTTKLSSLFIPNFKRIFYGRHHDLVNHYGISVSQMTTDMFHLSQTLLCAYMYLIHGL